MAVERQVEITGPDAARFVLMLTPRDLATLAVGQGKYILINNAEGGILNDPILLRLAENRFWISLADSDILLWAQGQVSWATSCICKTDLGGMLSYHADADINTNPYELGLDWLVNVDMSAEFIGKSAFRKIRDTGVTRKQVGLRAEDKIKSHFWPSMHLTPLRCSSVE